MLIDPYNIPRIERGVEETRAAVPEVKPEGLIHPERLPDTQRLDLPDAAKPVVHTPVKPVATEPVVHETVKPTVARPVTNETPALPLTHETPRHTVPLVDVARPITHSVPSLPHHGETHATGHTVGAPPQVVHVEMPPFIDYSRIVWRDGPRTH